MPYKNKHERNAYCRKRRKEAAAKNAGDVRARKAQRAAERKAAEKERRAKIAAEEGHSVDHFSASLKVTDEEIHRALKLTGGKVHASAQTLGVDAATIRRRVSPERLEKYRADFIEARLERLELELTNKINEGYWPALRFLALTKGGYSFKGTGANGTTVNIQINQALASLEQHPEWHEFARRAEADRYAGLLGAQCEPGAGGGAAAVERAPARDADGPDSR